ncbi:restriction endonuclease subunit S [Vreelandella malpeensis]|uniref:Restriction endonuclease subunit S n=1 Tax=Vreelandella malpeensis TaxID=1172368 RepID=A0ABS8DPJ5_9GAMM|nr:restriction endonuclease subunit S [Halomonas malpeensis]MCB8888222.1 restriction endonuclease subunit S [Halomonas malpeensis]
MRDTVSRGFQQVRLGEISRVTGGKRLPKGRNLQKERSLFPYIRVADFPGGQIDLDSVKFISPDLGKALSRYRVSSGDLIISVAGTLGVVAMVPDKLDGANLTENADRISAIKQALPEFLLEALRSDNVQAALLAEATQNAQPKLALERIRNLKFGLPPLTEQHEIVKILRTWDEALEKLTVLRDKKTQRLGSLRAALIFGSLRLNGQRSQWTPTRIAAVTHELTERNGVKGLCRDYVMGVTKVQGVVPMREQTIAGDISRYKRLPPRAFAYNPMRINVGSIAMNQRDEEVLVSPDYVVFACNADGLDPGYLDHLRKTSWWAHYINSGGSGSVRQRTYYADLAALKLPLPELDEQKAITEVLDTARGDLEATEREIKAVTRQKRGLMQKLLTGEWRVEMEE